MLLTPAARPSCCFVCALQKLAHYQHVFSSSYAQALSIPSSDVQVLSITCDGRTMLSRNPDITVRALKDSRSLLSVTGSSQLPGPGSTSAADPLLAALLSQPASLPPPAALASPEPTSNPSQVVTKFSVVASSESSVTATVADKVLTWSPSIMTVPLSQFYQTPVQIQSVRQLEDWQVLQPPSASVTAAVAAAAAAAAAARPTPSNSPFAVFPSAQQQIAVAPVMGVPPITQQQQPVPAPQPQQAQSRVWSEGPSGEEIHAEPQAQKPAAQVVQAPAPAAAVPAGRDDRAAQWQAPVAAVPASDSQAEEEEEVHAEPGPVQAIKKPARAAAASTAAAAVAVAAPAAKAAAPKKTTPDTNSEVHDDYYPIDSEDAAATADSNYAGLDPEEMPVEPPPPGDASSSSNSNSGGADAGNGVSAGTADDTSSLDPDDTQWVEFYDNAPTCAAVPTIVNSVYDGSGRLWGWEKKTMCVFRATSPQWAPVTWKEARACTGVPTASNSVYDESGKLWGWQDNSNCAFKVDSKQAKPAQLTWKAAPACSGQPSSSNTVTDLNGKQWGWNNGKSCAFRQVRHPATQGVSTGVCKRNDMQTKAEQGTGVCITDRWTNIHQARLGVSASCKFFCGSLRQAHYTQSRVLQCILQVFLWFTATSPLHSV